MDKHWHDERTNKFAKISKGTLLRVNAAAAVNSQGIRNRIVDDLCKRGDCLHIFEDLTRSLTYGVYAKSLSTGKYESFAVYELLMPGEEEFDCG